jgi:3-methyladenine DNA glycosylase Tag
MAKKTTTKKRAATKKRARWLDPKSHAPLIKQYAGQMESFLTAMADGKIEKSELSAQEKLLADLMREIEPNLDDDLHAKVTKLLCEITVYDMMQMTFAMQDAKPKAKFKG